MAAGELIQQTLQLFRLVAVSRDIHAGSHGSRVVESLQRRGDTAQDAGPLGDVHVSYGKAQVVSPPEVVRDRRLATLAQDRTQKVDEIGLVSAQSNVGDVGGGQVVLFHMTAQLSGQHVEGLRLQTAVERWGRFEERSLWLVGLALPWMLFLAAQRA